MKNSLKKIKTKNERNTIRLHELNLIVRNDIYYVSFFL